MFRPVLDLAHSLAAASQGFPEPGLRSGPCDTLPKVLKCGMDMEVIDPCRHLGTTGTITLGLEGRTVTLNHFLGWPV